MNGAEVILLEFNGWPVGFIGGDGAPRVSDVEICQRSGYGDIYKLRQKIREFAAEDEARASSGGKPRKFNPLGLSTDPVESGGRPGTVFWLNQHEAVFLMTQIKTPVARDVTHDVIDVFVMASHGELPQRQIAPKAEDGLERAKLIATFIPYLPSPETRAVAAAYGVALTTGHDVAPMLPELPNERWMRPTQIAALLGVSVAAVGNAISLLGLRGNKEFSKEILDQKAHVKVDAHVPCFLYNEAAVELLRKHFEANPWKPSKPKKKAPAEPASLQTDPTPANDAPEKEGPTAA
ncbi:hypothetical protein WMF30_40295 [Sorangium sp. So ce134]